MKKYVVLAGGAAGILVSIMQELYLTIVTVFNIDRIKRYYGSVFGKAYELATSSSYRPFWIIIACILASIIAFAVIDLIRKKPLKRATATWTAFASIYSFFAGFSLKLSTHIVEAAVKVFTRENDKILSWYLEMLEKSSQFIIAYLIVVVVAVAAMLITIVIRDVLRTKRGETGELKTLSAWPTVAVAAGTIIACIPVATHLFWIVYTNFPLFGLIWFPIFNVWAPF